MKRAIETLVDIAVVTLVCLLILGAFDHLLDFGR